MLKAYLVQMESKPGDKAANFAKARELVLGAAPEPGSLVVFPEMFDTGYVPQKLDDMLKASPDALQAKTEHFLARLAEESRCTLLGGGMWKTSAGITNHIGAFAPGKPAEVAGYNKVHPFFPEQGKFTAGNDVTLFKINEFTVAPSICYDLRFPELYREATRRGAEVFSVQAAWPAVRKSHWEALLKARAIENQTYVVAVNCVSANGSFTGDSQIISPEGKVIACAEAGKECVVTAELNRALLLKLRKDFPVLP